MFLRALKILLLAFLLIAPLMMVAQPTGDDPNRLSQSTDIGPLEVIRNIDRLLGETKIEAVQAGRGKEFNDKVNIAKSFVHANHIAKARASYGEAIILAWNRGEQQQLLESIHRELDRIEHNLILDSRPEGLDENYQPIEQAAGTPTTVTESMDKYAAGIKIDEMLAFLHSEILNDKAKQLTLIGDLSDCRHLVEMERFEEAEAAYHAAIIQHLDPRWTSQLLEEINGVVAAVEPTMTITERDPNIELTKQGCKEELDKLLAPVIRRYGGNAVFKRRLDSLHYLVNDGQGEAARNAFETTLDGFAPEPWIEHNASRFYEVIEHTPSLLLNSEGASTNAVAMDQPPILYFTDKMEGRTIERLRILEDNELKTYKKVTHNWGGVFYFVNEEPTKDTEWLRVWKLYELQQ